MATHTTCTTTIPLDTRKSPPADVVLTLWCKALIVETMIDGPKAMNKLHLARLIQGTVGVCTITEVDGVKVDDNYNPWDWAANLITHSDLHEARTQLALVSN